MIKLNNIILDNYSDLYSDIKNEFQSGNSKSNFIHNVSDRLEASKIDNDFKFGKAYVVLNSNLDKIGYVYLCGLVDDSIYMEYAILKEKRNLGYASMLVSELSEYIFLNYNIMSIKLDISPNNKSSINVALKCGYNIDEDDFEKCFYKKMLFVKDNPFYINKRKNK